MKINNPQYKGIIYMLICAVLWSTAGILIKLLPWNPMVIAGLRSLVAGCFYYLYMRHEKTRFVINKHSILSGIFLMGTFLFFVAANKFTTSANAIVLQYSAPIFIMIISSVIFRQRFRAGDIITVAATFIGIALFFLDDLAAGYKLGNLMAIGSGICFACMFIATGRADKDSRSSGIFLGNVFTAAVGIPFMFFSETTISTTTIFVILALGIFQLGLSYVFYGIAIQYCSPLSCSLISFAEPLLNPVWVFLIVGEAPGLFALIGGVIVISSIFIYSVWNNRIVIKTNNT